MWNWFLKTKSFLTGHSCKLLRKNMGLIVINEGSLDVSKIFKVLLVQHYFIALNVQTLWWDWCNNKNKLECLFTWTDMKILPKPWFAGMLFMFVLGGCFLNFSILCLEGFVIFVTECYWITGKQSAHSEITVQLLHKGTSQLSANKFHVVDFIHAAQSQEFHIIQALQINHF